MSQQQTTHRVAELSGHSSVFALVVRISLNVVWWLALLAGMLTVAGFFSRHFWLFDLSCHFRAQYAVSLGCAVAAFLLARQWRRGVVAGVFVALNAAVIAPLYLPIGTSVDEAIEYAPNRLRILAANVLTSNRRYDDLLDLARREQPDLIVLSEVNREWIDRLEPLRVDYPHHREVAQADNFGMALYSKLPLEDLETVELGAARLPAITAKVRRKDAGFTIYAVHVLPPSGEANWRERNQELLELAARVNSQQGAVVVIGDLNTTSWSAAFDDFAATTGLVDSRRGFGLQPSVPSDRLIVRIPIDHCLVSPGIKVFGRRVGPNIGSDHLPIVVDLGIGSATTGAAR
jgi:endonuclease/exonuclease/phosphatase (EEP) superfamily protein YafD